MLPADITISEVSGPSLLHTVIDYICYVCYDLLTQDSAFSGECDLFRPTTLSLTEFSRH